MLPIRNQCSECGKWIRHLYDSTRCYRCWRASRDDIIHVPIWVGFIKMRYIIDIETTGLSPFSKSYNEETGERITSTNRIICATSKSITDPEIGKISCFAEENEKSLLERFWDSLKDAEEIIGFNIYFDINFLKVRSLINGVRIPDSFKNAQILDLRDRLNNGERAVGRLRDYVEQLGIFATTDKGAEMPQLYMDKKWDEIRKHNIEDVELTHALLKRCEECNIV